MLIFIINIIFLFFIFFFLNRKIEKALNLENLRQEINQLINSFNRNLEKKILVVENSFDDFEVKKRDVDLMTEQLKKIIKEGEGIFKKTKIKGFKETASKLASRVAPELTLRKETKLQPKPSRTASQEKKNIQKNILKDDIIFFYQNGLSEKEIAKKLALSTEEVKLNLIK